MCEGIVSEADAVGEDVHCGGREEVAADTHQFDEAVLMDCGFASGEVDLRSAAGQEADEFEGMFEQPVVVCLFRRLRAHEAVVVASLREQNAVLSAVVPPENSDSLPIGGYRDNVTGGQ